MTQDDYVVMKRSSRQKLINELKEVKKENQQLKKQKDDVVEYIKHYINVRKNWYPYIDMREFDLDKLLRMLGETNE